MNIGYRHSLLCVLTLALVAGCTSTETSNTARTGKEQVLISNAVDKALNTIDFAPFAGKAVFLEEKYLDCVDKSYIIGSLRHRMLRDGVHLAAAADKADIIVEARSGALGTDTSNSFLGVPELVLPGLMTLPEMRIVTRSRQQGTAKLGLIAYDAKTKQVLGDGGVSLAMSDDNNWHVMGIGPFQTGSLRQEMRTATSHATGYYRGGLPRQIAFNSPAGGTDESSAIQLTSEETPNLSTAANPLDSTRR